MRRFGKYWLTPFRINGLGFIALIRMGALLLSLPYARRKTGSAGFMNRQNRRAYAELCRALG